MEIYTSMIYRGPGIVKDIAAGLGALLRRDGYRSIKEAIGADHQ